MRQVKTLLNLAIGMMCGCAASRQDGNNIYPAEAGVAPMELQEEARFGGEGLRYPLAVFSTESKVIAGGEVYTHIYSMNGVNREPMSMPLSCMAPIAVSKDEKFLATRAARRG